MRDCADNRKTLEAANTKVNPPYTPPVKKKNVNGKKRRRGLRFTKPKVAKKDDEHARLIVGLDKWLVG